MRIVIDARESGTSTGRYIDKLVEYLHKLKPQHEIILLAKSHRIEYLHKIAPSFKIARADYKEFTFAEQLGLLRRIYKLKPDLVHFGMTQQPILYTGKAVTTVHDLTTIRFTNPSKNPAAFKLKQLVYKIVIRIVAHKSAAIITPSKFVKQDLAKYSKVSGKKIYVTYEAADSIREPAKPVPGVTSPFLMYVGRPTPHKNLRRLIEAYSLSRIFHPQLKLVLAGKEDKLYKRHRKWANKEQVEGLIFTGYVSEGQLRWLYERTAAYVFPSLSEGFGLPGLEAMAHGAPVLASNATCLPEVYGPGADYFDPKDVKDMSDKINHVLDDVKHARSLSRHGQARARQFSWLRMAKQTLAIYEKTLRN